MDHFQYSKKNSAIHLKNMSSVSYEQKQNQRLDSIKLEQNQKLNLPRLEIITRKSSIIPIQNRDSVKIKALGGKLKKNQSIAFFSNKKIETNDALLSPKFKLNGVKLPSLPNLIVNNSQPQNSQEAILPKGKQSFLCEKIKKSVSSHKHSSLLIRNQIGHIPNQLSQNFQKPYIQEVIIEESKPKNSMSDESKQGSTEIQLKPPANQKVRESIQSIASMISHDSNQTENDEDFEIWDNSKDVRLANILLENGAEKNKIQNFLSLYKARFGQ